jgi:sugar phosphate isomerase/epimerase
MPTLTRRQYLIATAAGSAAALLSAGHPQLCSAREAIQRSGEPRFRPAIAAYSLRKYFSDFRGRPQQPATDGPAIDLFGFIDYCASLQCDAELTSYFVPADAGDDYLLRLKQHAFLNGTVISGSAIGNDFSVPAGEKLDAQIADAEKWIERAAIMGAPHLRIFAGTAKQLGDSEEKLREVSNAVNRCAKTAERLGVFLGIENHGGISSDQLLAILQRVESDWVGVNLDTGNFISDDPYRDIERSAPYAVNVQLKPNMRKPDGSVQPADFDRIAGILRQSNYQGFVALEYEEEAPYDRIPELLQRMRKAFAM